MQDKYAHYRQDPTFGPAANPNPENLPGSQHRSGQCGLGAACQAAAMAIALPSVSFTFDSWNLGSFYKANVGLPILHIGLANTTHFFRLCVNAVLNSDRGTELASAKQDNGF